VLSQACPKNAYHDVLPHSYSRAIAACFPLPFACPDTSSLPSHDAHCHPGQAGPRFSAPVAARCFALQALQLLGLCCSLVSLARLSVLGRRESAVGTLVMGPEYCERHLARRTFQPVQLARVDVLFESPLVSQILAGGTLQAVDRFVLTVPWMSRRGSEQVPCPTQTC